MKSKSIASALMLALGTIAFGATAQAAGSNIVISSPGNITLGNISNPNGSITVIAGGNVNAGGGGSLPVGSSGCGGCTNVSSQNIGNVVQMANNLSITPTTQPAAKPSNNTIAQYALMAGIFQGRTSQSFTSRRSVSFAPYAHRLCERRADRERPGRQLITPLPIPDISS